MKNFWIYVKKQFSSTFWYFLLSFLCQGCCAAFLHFIMVYLYGYLPLFCYSYWSAMRFPKPPDWSWRERWDRTWGNGSFPGFSAQDFCHCDGLFLQNTATSPLPISNICVYRWCELQAMSSTRSLLASANAALAF